VETATQQLAQHEAGLAEEREQWQRECRDFESRLNAAQEALSDREDQVSRQGRLLADSESRVEQQQQALAELQQKCAELEAAAAIRPSEYANVVAPDDTEAPSTWGLLKNTATSQRSGLQNKIRQPRVRHRARVKPNYSTKLSGRSKNRCPMTMSEPGRATSADLGGWRTAATARR